MPETTRDIREHPAGHMTGLGEMRGVTAPAAVVIRPDGSIDAYGQVAVIDQAQVPDEARRRLLACAATYVTDAAKFRDLPRTGGLPAGSAMTEADCRYFAQLYQAIADELRKTAAHF